jgi:two-component system, chemotaxis family, sensor kinase CheA
MSLYSGPRSNAPNASLTNIVAWEVQTSVERRVDELIGEFVTETRDTLENISGSLLAWEANPADKSQLDEIFRFVHTVKGSCGFLDLPRIGALAHAAETVLSEVRDGQKSIDAGLVSALLAVIDRIAVLSDALESKISVPDGESDTAMIAAIWAAQAIASPSDRVATPQARNVRVAVDVLETAMTQVSDLVLARNELARMMREREADNGMISAFDRLSVAISDVRETIARTRMQPIERLFALLPRLVRDTANAVGKSVQLRIEGSDVEIDREMIEAIRDPLTHIVRNAIDHGIEAADDRLLTGKTGSGVLTVTARQSGNQVSITVADDGRGIDVEKLVQKAITANIISATKASALSPDATLNLMFAPGLSTAETVTEISGRGVGMDVVRANVERLGGAIGLENRPGRGLSITLRAPLTLSIMNALLVESGGQHFAIPRAAIHEIVSVKSDSVRVEAIGGGHVAVVRGRMLSVVSLAAILGLRDEPLSHLVVVDPPGGNRFALGVALVRDHEELVVRPTAPHVAAIGTYAGQSLPDSGVPVLVLDPAGIAARAGIESERRHSAVGAVERVSEKAASLLLFVGLDGQRRAVRTLQVAHIDDVDADDFVTHGAHAYVALADDLVLAVVDGDLPKSGPVALLRLGSGESTVAYPVQSVLDLAPLPEIAVVNDGIVEGFVMIDGTPVALIAWPRTAPISTKQRRRA